MEKIALKGIKRERRKARADGPCGRKLNNQTFPQGSQGLLWKPTSGQGNGNGGEVTGKNQKNKRWLREGVRSQRDTRGKGVRVARTARSAR